MLSPKLMSDRRQNKERGSAQSTRRSTGFSLVELLVVLAISVVLASIAIPEVMNSVRSSRLRDAATQLSSLVQQGRILAEQGNVTVPIYTGRVKNNANGAFIACSTTPCASGGNGTTFQSGDKYYVPYGGDVTNGASASAPGTLSPGFTPATGTLYFSPRGVTSTSTGTLTNGTVFYLTDALNDWAAVSVSSIGKTKVWMWNGSSWN